MVLCKRRAVFEGSAAAPVQTYSIAVREQIQCCVADAGDAGRNESSF